VSNKSNEQIHGLVGQMTRPVSQQTAREDYTKFDLLQSRQARTFTANGTHTYQQQGHGMNYEGARNATEENFGAFQQPPYPYSNDHGKSQVPAEPSDQGLEQFMQARYPYGYGHEKIQTPDQIFQQASRHVHQTASGCGPPGAEVGCSGSENCQSHSANLFKNSYHPDFLDQASPTGHLPNSGDGDMGLGDRAFRPAHGFTGLLHPGGGNAAASLPVPQAARGPRPKKHQEKWTAEKDARLREADNGTPLRTIRQKYFPNLTESALQSRLRRLRKGREMNHTRQKSSPWTDDEKALIHQLIYQQGKRTTEIARLGLLPGRTETAIGHRISNMLAADKKAGMAPPPLHVAAPTAEIGEMQGNHAHEPNNAMG